MNFAYFISNRVSKSAGGTFSSTIHKIAVGSIAVGLAAMIVSFLILKGFQDTVAEKIYSFSSHIQVTKYTLGNSYDEVPVSLNNILFRSYQELDEIDHVQEYSHKAGLLKTDDQILGVIFKGVGTSFDTLRFRDNLVEGRFVEFTENTYAKEVVISRTIANKLQLNLEDDIIIHFFMNPPRPRKLKVVGIYETNLSDYYDDKFVMGDIRLVQRLNNWPDTLAGGMEVFVKDASQVEKAEFLLDEILDYDLFVEKISDKYIQVFEWLFLINRQVNIFLGIILLVVCVNMISIILILIMERTQMIGLLKAFGATNRQIRYVFTYNGISLVLKGLLGGNALGLGICMVQYYFRVMPLNPQDYYMSYVPIAWDWQIVLALNMLTFLVVSLIVMIPSMAIIRVNPIKSIRFD